MKQAVRDVVRALLIMICVSGAGCAHLRAGKTSSEEVIGNRDQAYEEMELFTEALLRIRTSYVDEEKTDYETLVYGAIRGMMSSLDRHSQFLDPVTYRERKEGTQGKFGGIGIEVTMRDGILTVITPLEDTPGFRANLLPGDQILKIDGEETTNTSLMEAVRKLRGDEGTDVVLNIYTPSADESRDVTIRREKVDFLAVKGTRMLTDEIGYIRIAQFSMVTSKDLQKALDELVAQNMQALVIDLRDNSGGLLSAAVSVGEKFLQKGTVIVSTENRAGPHGSFVFRSGKGDHLTEFHIVVLVNGISASASEIVAAALRDNNRAILLGQKTFGKGSVQSIMPLRDEKAALQLTTGKYFRPDGTPIKDGEGILPDVEVVVPADEWNKVRIKRIYEENPRLEMTEVQMREFAGVEDRQLLRAIDLLKDILIFESHGTSSEEVAHERVGD